MSFLNKFTCGFWNIGIIDTPVNKIVSGEILPSIHWMRHRSRVKFYADPFPIGEDGKYYYILAEEYSYFTGKGIIVKLAIDKTTFELKSRKVEIKTSYHLSFPFPYKEYVIPEQFRSGKLIAYNDGVESVICDYPVIDPVVLEYHGKKILFGTLPCQDNKGHNRSLFWFDWNGTKFSLKSEKPIKEDVKSSRFAGAFFEIDDSLYRPAQDCEKLYGGQTRIMRVFLDDDSYREEEVMVINSFTSDRFNEGLHTFNPWRNVVIVDGFQNEHRFFYKPLFVLFRIFRKLIKNA
jgi:hypothetical protein